LRAPLEAALPQAPAAALAAREGELRRQGVPEALARRIAALPALVGAPDIVMVADRTGRGPLSTGREPGTRGARQPAAGRACLAGR